MIIIDDYKGYVLITTYTDVVMQGVSTQQMTTIAYLNGEPKFGTFADTRLEDSIVKMKTKIDAV